MFVEDLIKEYEEELKQLGIEKNDCIFETINGLELSLLSISCSLQRKVRCLEYELGFLQDKVSNIEFKGDFGDKSYH